MTPALRRALFGAALGLCWLSAGAEPLIRVAVLAPQPNDFTPDFVAAHAWVHGGAQGPAAAVLDGPAGNAYAATIGAPAVTLLSAYYVHPPTAFLLMVPLCPLGYAGAALAWLALSVVLVGVLAASLRARAAPATPTPRSPIVSFVLLLLWPPVLSNLQYGQWSIVLATTIAAGYAAWERGRHGRGAAWFGAAVALKLTPIVLLPYVALRNRRATLALGATLAAILGLSLAVGQLDAWRTFFRYSAENVAAWQAYQHNTLSLGGLTARLLVGGAFARPLLAAPVLARDLSLAGGAGLAAVAVWRTIAPGAAVDRLRDGCCFALWNVVAVVTNPLAWPHYAILLLLPMTLVLRALDGAGARARVMRGLLAAALLLLTIPTETLDRLAGSAPVTPGRGLFVSTHLCGALLLFAAAALGTRGTNGLGAGPSAG
ncbi:MAG TPA: glycosyltransferase family 87 protein [Polyangia bacterium]